MRTNHRRTILASVIAILALSIGTVFAAAPSVTGTFVTPKKSGTMKFTAVKAVRVGSWGVAYQGNVNISGKRYPGTLYGTSLTWFYTPNYETNGDARLALQTDGSYAGPITFYSKLGAIIDQGTAKAVIK
ncbi:MAG: hypothetical protein JNM99_20420 [Verrucomicrobiaceae bacterium]|nr:hypothetical protein [Verrucomicrobiaceae bacterium]